ncbi:MAG: PilZ domain-containing protein [Natronospirillum sp.]|uniref:PilZ domain-containing protein n=1 Tax=Natronospirillum sp. TaxID=2812955 RepID=UPI0025CFBD6B|nr:PilZ domain-containing protein [Natronospirillum sp.]MCH8550517.1 PilZ domain-containing protein [Natronospirillum sp.]
MEDTRRFTRLPITLQARLTFADQVLEGELHDVSLKGALMLALGDPLPPDSIGHPGALKLDLNDGELVLAMAVRVAHLEDHYIGLEFTEMDIDTISHLRRMVELNLGLDDVLQRELGMLWDNRNRPNRSQ